MYSLKLDSSPDLAFETRDDVFHPTGTSLALVRAFSRESTNAGKLLDLGCGCGVVGVTAGKLGLAGAPVYASDLSPEAVEVTRVNAAAHGCEIVAKNGSLFEPWAGETFDTILDDVSGVAEAVAKVSPWFARVPCAAGTDGTDLVCEVIRQSPLHLRPNGRLYFPIISLSKEANILEAASKAFSTVRRIAHEKWPLPKEMAPHAALLRELHAAGTIKIIQKFGMIIFSTDIYVAHNA